MYPIGGVSWMFMTSLSALRARIKPLYLLVLMALAGGSPLLAQGEAELKLPDLSTALFQGVVELPRRGFSMIRRTLPSWSR